MLKIRNHYLIFEKNVSVYKMSIAFLYRQWECLECRPLSAMALYVNQADYMNYDRTADWPDHSGHRPVFFVVHTPNVYITMQHGHVSSDQLIVSTAVLGPTGVSVTGAPPIYFPRVQ